MIHHVYANRSNIGDWLSAKGIQQLVGQPVVEHLCDQPFVPNTIDSLSCLSGKDFVIIGGGGLFMDYFTPFWKGFLPIAGRAPFCIWGVGFVDLKQEHSRPNLELLREVIAQSRHCWVRDEHTRSLLRDLTLPEPVPCPSFAAISSNYAAEQAILHSANLTTVGQRSYDRMRGLAEAFAESTGRAFREVNNRVAQDSEDEMQRIVDLYARSDVVLTSRLHGCIISLALGRKVVAVSGDYKIDSFMESAGLGEWCLVFDRVDEVKIKLESASSQLCAPRFVKQALEKNEKVAEIVRSEVSI